MNLYLQKLRVTLLSMVRSEGVSHLRLPPRKSMLLGIALSNWKSPLKRLEGAWMRSTSMLTNPALLRARLRGVAADLLRCWCSISSCRTLEAAVVSVRSGRLVRSDPKALGSPAHIQAVSLKAFGTSIFGKFWRLVTLRKGADTYNRTSLPCQSYVLLQ